MSDKRVRSWLAIFYPESCPSDWASVIESWQVKCFVSPLHDADRTEAGDLKKPHYHLILCFDGPTSYKCALDLVSQLGCSTAKVCNSLVCSVRYLCHLDSPDKFHYSVDDISLFGGASLSVITQRSPAEVDADVAFLASLIFDNQVTEYASLVRWVLSYRSDLFPVVYRHASFFTSLLSSQRAIRSFTEDTLSPDSLPGSH